MLWIIVPWLILVFMPHNKQTSYIVPYLPAVAIVTVIGIRALLKRTGRVVLAVCLSVGAVQSTVYSFVQGGCPRAWMLGHRCSRESIRSRGRECRDDAGVYLRLRELLRKESVSREHFFAVLLPPCSDRLNHNVVRSLAFHGRLPVDVRMVNDPFDLSVVREGTDVLIFEGDGDLKNDSDMRRYVQTVRENQVH